MYFLKWISINLTRSFSCPEVARLSHLSLLGTGVNLVILSAFAGKDLILSIPYVSRFANETELSLISQLMQIRCLGGYWKGKILSSVLQGHLSDWQTESNLLFPFTRINISARSLLCGNDSPVKLWKVTKTDSVTCLCSPRLERSLPKGCTVLKNTEDFWCGWRKSWGEIRKDHTLISRCLHVYELLSIASVLGPAIIPASP